MPCLFTSPKMFSAGPNFLCQTKNLFTYCGSHKHFVPEKKDDLHSVKLVFVQSNFGTGSNNLNRHKTFWDLSMAGDEALEEQHGPHEFF